MFIPDYRAGVPVSGMGALVGGEYVGYAAGFGNTFGILTFAAAITAAALAYSATGRGRACSRVLPTRFWRSRRGNKARMTSWTET